MRCQRLKLPTWRSLVRIGIDFLVLELLNIVVLSAEILPSDEERWCMKMMMMTIVKWIWRRCKQFINFPKLFWSDWSIGNLQSFCWVTRPRFKPSSDASHAVLCYGSIVGYTGFEVLTAEVVERSIIWDIMLFSRLKVSRLFEGICHLHLQGRRIREVRNQREIKWKQNYRWILC
jgi:hypothetical protein